jgi:hypothetical protein
MPRAERERVLARVAEMEYVLRHTRSEDVREVLWSALQACLSRLAELDAVLGIAAPEAT